MNILFCQIKIDFRFSLYQAIIEFNFKYKVSGTEYLLMQADFIGSCRNCNQQCLEKDKEEFNYHQKKAGKHRVFSTKNFQEQTCNFFNFCSLKVWDSVVQELKTYFAEVKNKIRVAQSEVMESIDKLKIQTVLRTKDDIMTKAGDKILKKKYLSLQCRQVDHFLETLKSNKIEQAEVSKSISDYIFQVESKIQKIFKTQIKLNNQIKLSDSDLNMLRNFSNKSDIQQHEYQKKQPIRYADEDEYVRVQRQSNRGYGNIVPYDDKRPRQQNRNQNPKRQNRNQDPRRQNRNQNPKRQNRNQNPKRQNRNQDPRRQNRNQNPKRQNRNQNPKRQNRNQDPRRQNRNQNPKRLNREQRNNKYGANKNLNYMDRRDSKERTRGQSQDQRYDKYSRGNRNNDVNERMNQQRDDTIFTIHKVENSAGGKFNIQLKVLKILGRLHLRGEQKIQLEGGDSTGTAIYLLRSSPLIKQNAYIQVSSCYVFVFRGTKQIQSSQQSQIKQCFKQFEVSTAYNFSKNNRNRNKNKNFDTDSKHTNSIREERRCPINKRERYQDTQYSQKSETGSKNIIIRGQNKQRGNYRRYEINERNANEVFNKISQIGPQDETICMQAQVFKIINIKGDQIFCQLGDDTGLVNAIMPFEYSFIQQGVSIRIQHGLIQVIEGHIFVTIQQISRVSRVNRQFKIINIGMDISKKQWEQIDD